MAVPSQNERSGRGFEFDLISEILPEYLKQRFISRSYQYLMIKEGGVLVRRHSCWCLPCLQAAMIGHYTLTSNNVIKGCARGVAGAGISEYANRNCRAKTLAPATRTRGSGSTGTAIAAGEVGARARRLCGQPG